MRWHNSAITVLPWSCLLWKPHCRIYLFDLARESKSKRKKNTSCPDCFYLALGGEIWLNRSTQIWRAETCWDGTMHCGYPAQDSDTALRSQQSKPGRCMTNGMSNQDTSVIHHSTTLLVQYQPALKIEVRSAGVRATEVNTSHVQRESPNEWIYMKNQSRIFVFHATAK